MVGLFAIWTSCRHCVGFSRRSCTRARSAAASAAPRRFTPGAASSRARICVDVVPPSPQFATGISLPPDYISMFAPIRAERRSLLFHKTTSARVRSCVSAVAISASESPQVTPRTGYRSAVRRSARAAAPLGRLQYRPACRWHQPRRAPDRAGSERSAAVWYAAGQIRSGQLDREQACLSCGIERDDSVCGVFLVFGEQSNRHADVLFINS